MHDTAKKVHQLCTPLTSKREAEIGQALQKLAALLVLMVLGRLCV